MDFEVGGDVPTPGPDGLRRVDGVRAKEDPEQVKWCFIALHAPVLFIYFKKR